MIGSRQWLRPAAALLLGSAAARADVYISEVFHHPLATASDEWVEIYNPDNTTVDLTGYYLDDGEGALSAFKFPAVSLAGGEYLRVNISGSSNVGNLVLGAGFTTGQLANGGDEVALYDALNTAVDFVRWGTSVTAPPGGVSWTGTIATGSPGQALAFTGSNPDNAASWTAQTATPQSPNVAPTGTLRINEVMIEDADEWVEIAYSGANGNLWDYLFTGGGETDLRLPYYPLSGSGYVVIYLGTPGSPVANSVELGLGANALNNTSGSVLLETLFNSSRAASMAWGGGSVSGFSGAVSLASPYTAGDSLAWLETSGNNANASAQWINRRGANVTVGTLNSEQVGPTVAIGTPTPAANFASCENIVFPIDVTHTDEAPVRNVTVTLDLDALTITGVGSVAYVAHAGGESGTAYDSGTNTLTWVLDSVSADVNDLTVTLAPSLGVSDFSIPAAALEIAYDRYDNGDPGDLSSTAAAGVGPFAVDEPVISVEVVDFDNPANDYAESSANGFFDLRVRITNSGSGDAPAGAVTGRIYYDSGLRYITVREDNATGAAPNSVTNSSTSGVLEWEVTDVPAGSSQDYYVRFRVRECLDLDLSVETDTICPSDPGGTPIQSTDSMSLFCGLAFFQSVPGSNVTAGEEFTVRWIVQNPNSVNVPLGDAVFTFPEDFYLMDVLDKTGASMGLTWGVDYDGSVSGGLKTVTIPAALLVPDNVGSEDTLPGSTTSTTAQTYFDFVLKGDCEPASDEKTLFQLEYTIGGQTFNPTFSSSGITTDQPSLSTAIVDETDSLDTTLTAARGDTIDFLLTITNNGDGDLLASTDTNGALATIIDPGVGAGLEIIGVYAGAPSTLLGSPVNLIDPGSSDFDWTTGALASGATQEYTLRVQVIDCNDLDLESNVTYSISGRPDIPSDACDLDPGPVSALRTAQASVELLLDAPALDFVVNTASVSVAYCDDDTATVPGELVSIDIDNNGVGAAASLQVTITGLDLTNYDVTDAPGSDFTFDSINSGNAIFVLTGGTDEDVDGSTDDLESGETAQLRFYLSLKDSLVNCSPTLNGASTVILDFTDLCGFDYETADGLFVWQLDGTLPSASLDAIGAGAGLTDRAASGTWSFDLEHFGEPGSDLDYTFTVDFPGTALGDFTAFTIDAVRYQSDVVAPATTLTDGVHYSVDSINGTVTITVNSASAPWMSDAIGADGSYTATIEVDFTSPANICGDHTVTALLNWAGSPTTCKGCPLTDPLAPDNDIDLDYGDILGTLDISANSTNINAGDPSIWTVVVTYTGAPLGTFDYDIDIAMGAAYTVLGVTDSTPAPITPINVSGTDLSWSIAGATFDADGLYTETFTVTTISPAPQCDDTAVTATLSVTDDSDLCVQPPADLSDAVTIVFPDTPSDEVEVVVDPTTTIVAGDSGSWTIDFHYYDADLSGFTYELTIDHPDIATDGAGADFTITSVQRGATTLTAGVDYTGDGETIFISTSVISATEEYDEIYTVNYSTSSSAVGSFPTTANINVTSGGGGVDPAGCQIPETTSGSATTTILEPGDFVIEDEDRTATYLNLNDNGLDLGATVTDRGEDGTTLRLASKFKFEAGTGSTWSGVVFSDTLENGLEVRDDDVSNLNLKIYYFASVGVPASTSGETNVGPTEYAGTDLIELSAVTYNAGINQLQIDLAALDGLGSEPDRPNDGGWLWIEYDVVSTNTSTIGNFTETATILPDNDVAVDLTLDASIPGLTLERILGVGDVDGFVDHCEVVTYRINLTNSDPWDTYDTRIVVELGNTADLVEDFEYATGSVVFSNLVDENGASIAAFEPTLSGTNDQVLTWNLGDLRDVQGNTPYIEFQLTKTCDSTDADVTALIYSRRHSNNLADTALSGLTAPGDFDNSSGVLEENLIRKGRLVARWATETVFYTTGYPRLRLDILNVGSGTLSNVQLPIELGDLGNADGLRSLSFVSASIVEIEGTAPGVSTGALGAAGAARIVDNDATESGTNGDTTFLLEIDEIGPASIVTVEITTRMHLNTALQAHVDGATWGCDFNAGFSACTVGSSFAELNDTISIVPGTTRVEVTSNQAVPDLLDFCGDLTTITIRVANTGGVQAYEPIVQVILPEGLEIDASTATYRLNDTGAFTPFSGGSAMGGRATAYAVNAGRETITWNFADPNDNDDESDSPLSASAFDDPLPADSDGVGLDFFNRGRVIKPGQAIEIRFDAAIPAGDCNAALAYDNGSKQALATVLYDVPANHDNSVNAVFASDPNRAPFETASLVSNFLEPGGVDIVAGLSGSNATKTGASSTTRVNGEVGDTIDWVFTVESIGDGNVPQLVVEFDVPTDYSVVGGTGGFTIVSPADVSLNGTPTAMTAGGTTTYTLYFDHASFDNESYLGNDETLEIQFSTQIDTCSATIQSIDALARFGCCDGVTQTPQVSGASGQDIASTEIKTLATGVTVTSYEGSSSGADANDFTSCGGMVTIVITNPDQNNELPLPEMLLTFPLPTGFTYDDSIPTNWSYSGTGARPIGEQLTEGAAGEAEPALSGSTLFWSPDDHPTLAGNIPSAKGTIRAQETVTIQFYLKADGSPYCDLTEGSDPWSGSPSSFSVTPTFSWDNGCGASTPSSIGSLSVSPEGADLDLTLTPSPEIIDESTPSIQWTVEISNNGNAPAANATFYLDFGDGYNGAYATPTLSVANTASSSEVVGATEDPDNLGPGGNDAHDLEILFSGTIAAGQTLSFTITRTIDTSTRGDLSAVAIVRGLCNDAVGDPNCQYSYDYAAGRIAGGSLIEVIDENSLNEPSVETTAHPGVAGTFPLAAGIQTDTANVTIGSIFRQVYRIEVFEGGDTDVELIVSLPSGVAFLHANTLNSAGTPTGTLTEADGDTTGVLNFNDNVTGSATGTNALFYEVWLQVRDFSGITAGTTLTIPAEVEFVRVDRTFTKTDIAGLQDSNAVTVIEPSIENADIAKTSIPTSLADDHTPASGAIDTNTTTEIDYVVRAKNTGTSPAYEVTIEDDIPAGLSDPTASLVVTVLDAGLTLDRTLTVTTDYVVSAFTPSTTPGTPATFVITLQNTANAAIQPDETLQLAYTCSFVSLSPGAYVDNSAEVTSYSSLPGDGADVAITNLGTVSESDGGQERSGTEYTNGLFPKQTYHFITGDLTLEKRVRATFTWFDNNTAPTNSATDTGVGGTSFTTTSATRATIGEEVRYQVRLKIPPAVQLSELVFEDTVPDGLTVTDILWEQVADGAAFGSPNSSFAIPSESSGATNITMTHGAANVWNSTIPTNPAAVFTDLLIEIIARVDNSYNEGSPVSDNDTFANEGTFSWLTFTTSAIVQSDTTNEVLFAVREPYVDLAGSKKVITAADEAALGTATYFNFYDEGPLTVSEVDPVPGVTVYPTGTTITYQVTIANTGNTAAYDVVVQDLIPTGMTYDTGSVSIAAGATQPVLGGTTAIDGTTVTAPTAANPQYAQEVRFTLDILDEGQALTLEYTATIDTPVVAGRYLQNRVDLWNYTTIEGTSLYERFLDRSGSPNPSNFSPTAPDYAGIGTPFPSITKTVATELTNTTPTGATIGELLTYTITLNLEENYLLPDFWLHDDLPEGTDKVAISFNNQLVATPSESGTSTDRRVEVVFDDDVLGVAAADDLIITLTAQVDDANDAGSIETAESGGPNDDGSIISSLFNDVNLSWNSIDEDPSPGVTFATSYLNGADARATPTYLTDLSPTEVTVVLREPEIDVFSKTQVNSTATRGSSNFWAYLTTAERPDLISNVEIVHPLDVIVYTVEVTNNGSVPAFDVTITDTLPPKEFVTFVDQNSSGSIDENDLTDYSGSAGSTITATPSPVATDIDSIVFVIDFLLPGETATIEYEIAIDTGIGAGLYIGDNEAVLTDYSTLPDGTLAVNVGNLTAGNLVYDVEFGGDDDERSILLPASDPNTVRYASFNDGDDLGVAFPTFAKAGYQLFDDNGDEITPLTTALTGSDTVRAGDVLRFIVSVTQPPNTVLFDGPGGPTDSALLLEDILPRGLRLRSGSEVASFGTPATLTGSFSATPAFASVNSGQRHRYRWAMGDVANTAATAETWTFQFDVDVTGYQTDNSTNLLSLGALYDPGSNNNQARLFWDTIDNPSTVSGRLAQEDDFAYNGTAGADSDKPHLQTTSPAVAIGQPNVSVVKEAFAYDAGGSAPAYLGSQYTANDVIGVTASTGDEIVYRLTYTAAGTTSTNTGAYDFQIVDYLPERLRPAALTIGTDLSAANFLALVEEAGGGTTVLNGDDYTLVYENLTGSFTFTGTYDSTASSYDAQLDPGDALVIYYRVQLDEDTGATGGGVGQRVNSVDSFWDSVPYDRMNTRIAAIPLPNTDVPKARSYEDFARTFALELPSPTVTKSAVAPAAGESVADGDVIEYQIVVPGTPIRADMYDVEIVDVLPDGLEFEADGTITGAAGVAGVGLDVGGTYVAGDEVLVRGGSGNVTITISGRTLTVNVAKIENSDDAGPAFDDDTAFDFDADQVVITVKATVDPAGQFENLSPIERLHEFENIAQFRWYDDAATNPDRVRFAALSGSVSHFYNASGILFSPDHASTVKRGEVVQYRHVLKNFEDAPTNVTLTWPTSTRGWTWQLYLADKDGNLTSGPFSSGQVVAVPAESAIDLVMRAFVPTSEPRYATDVLQVTATGTENTIIVTDITTLQDEQVTIVKDISKDGGATFDTRLTVDPDDSQVIIQRLNFINSGPSDVKEIFIYDFMPEHTEYVLGSATDNASYELQYSKDGGVSWTVANGNLSGEATVTYGATTVVPAVTNLRWRFTANGGVMTPGILHTLQFSIRVE